MTIDNFTKLYWLRRFSGTRRFHAEEFQGIETTAHHSANVALILLTLVPQQCSAALLTAALTHDLEEGDTGDHPAPIKWALGREKLEAVEAEIRAYYQFPTVTLSEEEVQLLKAADFLDAVLTCLRQRMIGNLYIDRVFRAYETYEARSHVLTVSVPMQQLWYKILTAYDHYAFSSSPINPTIAEAEKINYWKNRKQAQPVCQLGHHRLDVNGICMTCTTIKSMIDQPDSECQ